MTEELTQLPLEKLHAAYIQARTNLSTSRNEAILLRLLQIADKLPQQTESPTQAEAAELLLPKAEDLQSAVSAFERRIIQEALTQSNGKGNHAAKLLNIPSIPFVDHQHSTQRLVITTFPRQTPNSQRQTTLPDPLTAGVTATALTSPAKKSRVPPNNVTYS